MPERAPLIPAINEVHNIKAGVTYEHTFITERDTLGLVDPTANAPCLNANGSPDTSPALTNPNSCAGALQPNPNFIPLLACYDLTRTSPLPSSDGCPNSTSGEYAFYGHADIKEFAAYIQDAITLRNWTFNLGLRFDKYNGLTHAAQGEPRLGVAYNFKPTNTVLRVSYARTMETPFNENLVLASDGCHNPVINAFQTTVPGGACVSTTALSPGHRNEFHAGLQQAFGKYLVIDAEYIWKYTHKAFDFSVLGNTPITYPIEWQSSKIPGYAIRATVPNFHGLTAFLVISSVAARFFEPASGGDRRHSGCGIRRIPYRSRRAISTRPPICNINREKQCRGSASTGGSTADCGWSSTLRRRRLRQWPEWDAIRWWTLPSYARSAIPGRALLRERVCDAHHADQPEQPLPGFAIWVEVPEHPGCRNGE